MSVSRNPLLSSWSGPYGGVPPWDEMQPEYFPEAFESAIAELELFVKTLEEGDLALEKSLELYERGVQLSRFCHSRLEEAERRIEVLNERGQLTTGQNLKLEGDK